MSIFDALCFFMLFSPGHLRIVSVSMCAGTFGGARNPSQFLCLTLKLLQIQPEPEVVREYILQEDSKYLRILGAFYLRLTGKADQVRVP